MIKFSITPSYQKRLDETHQYISLYNSSNDPVQQLGYKALFQYKSFIRGKQDESCHYIKYNLYKIMAEISANCVVGLWYELDFIDEDFVGEGDDDKYVSGEEMNKNIIKYHEECDMHPKMLNAAKEQSYAGIGIMRLYKNKVGKWKVAPLPIDNYFPWCAPGIGETLQDINLHYVITTYQDDNDKTKYYSMLYEYRYNMEDDVRDMTVEKHNFTNVNNLGLDKHITYNESTYISTISEERLPYLPIFFFNNDYTETYNQAMDTTQFGVTSKLQTSFGIGRPDWHCVKDIAEEINSTITNVSIELLSNIKSKMSIPKAVSEKMNRDKKKAMAKQWIRADQMGMLDRYSGMQKIDSWVNVFFHEAGEQIAQYIQKDPSYLDRSFTWLEKIFILVSSVTGIPKSDLGLEENVGGEKVGTSNNRRMTHIASCETKRKLITRTIAEMNYWIAVEQYGRKWGRPKVTFTPLVDNRKDPVTVCNMYQKWLLSMETAIAEAMWYDAEQVKEEIDKINKGLLTTSKIFWLSRDNRAGADWGAAAGLPDLSGAWWGEGILSDL